MERQRSVTGGVLAVIAVVIGATFTGIVERTCRPTGGVVSTRVYRAVVNAGLTPSACIQPSRTCVSVIQ